MAIIQSGASSETLTIDSASNAARVTLYNTNGVEVGDSQPIGSYLLPINIRQSTAAGTGVTVWALRNTGTTTLSIRRIVLTMGFDGVAVASTMSRYELIRFYSATPSGGTALTPVKKRTTYPTSGVDARLLDTGLTVTGVTFDAFPFYVISRPTSVTSVVTEGELNFMESGQTKFSPFELAVNEGLAIRLTTVAATTIIGVSLTGMIEWDER